MKGAPGDGVGLAIQGGVQPPEISSAALLVKVTAQIRGAGMRCTRIRCSIRWMRQKVLPAPGPATTSTGPSGASMARRWEGSGRSGPDMLLSYHAALTGEDGRVSLTYRGGTTAPIPRSRTNALKPDTSAPSN